MGLSCKKNPYHLSPHYDLTDIESLNYYLRQSSMATEKNIIYKVIDVVPIKTFVFLGVFHGLSMAMIDGGEDWWSLGSQQWGCT